jgi:hypothetical protein
VEPSFSSKDQGYRPEDEEQRSVGLKWEHEPNGLFIRGEFTDVALVFDSTAKLWRLKICKRKTPLGQPVAYEIVFKEQYAPTVEKAIELANRILDVELREEA